MVLAEASRVVQPASSFAALLRRSRFASYDKAINQVYTSHGGEVHRGNWGVKRSLPMRRRNAYLSFNSIDSNEQQTEFNRAEHQTRFVQRWDEVSPSVEPAGANGWGALVGKASTGDKYLIDSEFSPYADTLEARAALSAEEEKAKKRSQGASALTAPYKAGTIPNIKAMSPRQFDRYLEKLRDLRPQFEAWLKDLAAEDSNYAGKSMAEIAKSSDGSALYRKFLAYHTAKQLSEDTSRTFEQKPHRNAGLKYASPSYLQTSLTTQAQPGLAMQTVSHSQFSTRRDTQRHGGNTSQTLITSFAGIGATLSDAGGRRPLYNPDSHQGMAHRDVDSSVVSLRVASKPVLKEAPKVVGLRKQGLKGSRMEVNVVLDSKMNWRRENPHTPGSREYVACDNRDATMPGSMGGYSPVMQKAKRQRQSVDRSTFKAEGAAAPTDLLGSLAAIVGNLKKSSD